MHPTFTLLRRQAQPLTSLHLNYETCERYPDLKVEPVKPSLLWEEKPEHFLLGKRAMRFANKETKDTLIINEHVQLSRIPRGTHIVTSSTVDRRSNGLLTATKSQKTETAVSSTTQTAGSRTLATSSLP